MADCEILFESTIKMELEDSVGYDEEALSDDLLGAVKLEVASSPQYGAYHSSEQTSKSRDCNARTIDSSRNSVPEGQEENNRFLLQESKEDVTSDATNSSKQQLHSLSSRSNVKKKQPCDDRVSVACLQQLEGPRGEEHKRVTRSSKLCQDKCQMSPENEPCTPSQLEDSENSHSQDTLYRCDTCSDTFSNKEDIIRHVKTHMVIKEYTCDRCGEECGTRKRFYLHMHKHKYECEHCEKRFTNVSAFNKHLRRHEDDRPYKCQTCEKRFMYRSDLVDHMKHHFKEKPHQCKICSKSFLQIDNLHAHERIHSGERPFKCSICAQSFTQNSHLKRHMMMHKGEKEVCKTCGKSVASYYLKVHEQIHSDIKPFVCQKCGKAFMRNTHLTLHARIHSSKRNYACTKCGKVFEAQGPLNFHMKTHSGKKSFKCQWCDESFSKSTQLKKHQQSCVVEP